MYADTGLRGRFFGDYEVGTVYRHPIGRTVLAADDVWFTNITVNTNQVHFNEDYAARTNYKRTLVNSCFTFNLVQGLTEADISLNGKVLRWENIRMPNPLFHGETLYAESKVLATDDRAGSDCGIVRFATRGVTESGKIVMEFLSTVAILKNAKAPKSEDIR